MIIRAGRVSFCAAVLSAIAIGGCYRRFDIVDRIDVDGGLGARDSSALSVDARPAPDASFVEPSGRCVEPAGVDLLFVIDDSSSMAEEQAALITQLPVLVRDLVDPPDGDGDGEPDWRPIPSLQIGVISTDMGSAGFPVPGCDRGSAGTRLGDDGILTSRGDPAIAGCRASYPPILAFGLGDGPASLVRDVSCVASVGTDGCGFEQPLEAALKALAPSAPTSYTRADYVPPIFFDGTSGHGDRENAGLVRDDTLLAIIVITDEEDCSARDPELFSPSTPVYPGEPNLRCFLYPDALHPIERTVEGLLALRAHRPDLFALAIVAGVPAEAARELPSRADYESLLEREEMLERVDPDRPTSLLPACSSARGSAPPGRRLVRAAMAIGEGRSTVQSVCGDFSAAVAPITRLFVRRACNSRDLD